MSGDNRRLGAPQGAPWSLDELADFHAGVLDEQRCAELRSVIDSDQEAQDVLAALDTTSTDLESLPPLEIPDDVATRLEAALQDEVRAWTQAPSTRGGTVTSLPPRQEAEPQPELPTQASVADLDSARRRRRRLGWGAGLLAAAAAVVGVAVLSPALLNNNTGDDQRAVAEIPQITGPPPLAFQGNTVSLNRNQFNEVLNSDQLGALSNPQKLISCLQANGVNSGKPMGARTVTLNGRTAQLLLLSNGKIGQFRLLTVGPDCGTGNPATISDSTFGG
jgi:hypothetical protein